jgi:hypothetical protein
VLQHLYDIASEAGFLSDAMRAAIDGVWEALKQQGHSMVDEAERILREARDEHPGEDAPG